MIHVNFAKFPRISFLQNTSGWVLLYWPWFSVTFYKESGESHVSCASMLTWSLCLLTDLLHVCRYTTCSLLTCVCVGVCLYSSTCWFLPAARRPWHRDVRINDLFLWVLLGASAKFLHLYFWIYHISPPKTKTPADRLLERKRYDIMFALKKITYILIQDISRPTTKTDSDGKILKIRLL